MLSGSKTQRPKNEEAASHQARGLPVGSYPVLTVELMSRSPASTQPSQKEIYRPAVKLIRDWPNTAPLCRMLDAFI